MRRTALLACAVLLLAAAGAAGCFTPMQPACAFSCAVDHVCPPSYACGDDGFCHRTDDGGGACLLSAPDGSADTQD
jgi:hypothetical protein